MNAEEPTFAGVNAYSCKFWPVRCTSLWCMYTPARSVTATEEDALTAAFATLVAVMVCTPGRLPGVYSPAVEMVPLVAVPPLLLSTDQTTPEFEGSLNTVAVNCTVCNADIVTAARLGLTATLSDTDLNAAKAAAQLSDAPSNALAEAVPAASCIWSSAISFVFGFAGTASSTV